MSVTKETVSCEDQSQREFNSTKHVHPSGTDARLAAENQQLLAELDAGQKREAELIEHLVSAQMCIDKLQAIRLAQKRTIAEMKQTQLPEQVTEIVLRQSKQNKNHSLATAIRIRELEREVDYLTAHVEELSTKSQEKAAAWRYIEAQQDSLKARAELAKLRTLVDELRDQLEHAQATNNQAEREVSLANAELASTKRAHEEHARRTREQINRLMKQIHAERRKAVIKTREELKQLGQADSEELQQAIEELRNEVGWLKYLSTVLQESCDSLKLKYEEIKHTEAILAQTKSELRCVRRELAATQLRAAEHAEPAGTVAQMDGENHNKPYQIAVQNPLFQLKLENHRLEKLVQLLQKQLTRTTAPFQVPYHFITGI